MHSLTHFLIEWISFFIFTFWMWGHWICKSNNSPSFVLGSGATYSIGLPKMSQACSMWFKFGLQEAIAYGCSPCVCSWNLHCHPGGWILVGHGFIFHDDNAYHHRARIVEDFHDRHMDYTHMQWPVCIPDMNPIEHAWEGLLDRSHLNPDEELMLELQIQWPQIQQVKIKKVIHSMRKHVRMHCS